MKIDQSYSDYRKGEKARLDSLAYLQLQDLKVIDLDTAKAFTPAKDGSAMSVKLDVPITDDRQSAHIRITGVLMDPGYNVEGGAFVQAQIPLGKTRAGGRKIAAGPRATKKTDLG